MDTTFNENSLAYQVWKSKYAKDGEVSPIQTIERVCKAFSEAEGKYKTAWEKTDKNLLSDYGKKRQYLSYEKIFDLMKDFKYVIPGGSVLSGLGTDEIISVSNCFVISSPNDSYHDIMKSRTEQVELMKRRGGVGYDLSKLRPRNAKVNNAAKSSTGAASFMDVCSDITNETSQCGRRGALMLTLSITHPDAEEFALKKQNLTKVTGANISLKVTDEFMKKVEGNADFIQRFPIDLDIDNIDLSKLKYNELTEVGGNQFVKRIKAKELWKTLIHCAWNTAEPGIIFDDRMHNYAPDGVYDEFKMISTNPCFHPDTLIETVDGKKRIADITEPTLVFSMDENGHVCISECSASFKTKENAKTLKITLRNGSSIMVTPEHKMFVQGVGFVEANKLKIGDKIAHVADSEFLKLSTETDIVVKNDIVSIEEGEQVDVYDIQVPETHCLIANNMVAHNCGEIGLGAHDSCRLIHINLASFINHPFTDNAEIDKEKLYSVSYEMLRLGDDLVDLELEHVSRILAKAKNDNDVIGSHLWQEIYTTGLKGRRIGLGLTALADMLAMLGIKFCSEESMQVTEEVMSIIFKAQLDATIDLSIERGHFPSYNKDNEWGSDNQGENDWYKFISEKYPDQAVRMMKYGRRNLSFSTIAPTGTVSILTGTSSGLEPVFMPYYERKKKCNAANDRVDYVDKVGEKYTLYLVIHPKLKEWALTKYGDIVNDWGLSDWDSAFKDSPYYGSTAHEINWKERVLMQSIMQKYITHSISSTINLPKDTTEEEVSEIYFKAWQSGNKGQTIYRDTCREGVLNKVGADKPADEIIPNTAPKRPKELEADYYQVRVSGETFAVIVGLYNGKPYEIFAFRCNDNKSIPNHKGKIIKRKKMHYSFVSDKVEIDALQSTHNGTEEQAATLYTSMLLRHGVDINQITKVAKKVNDNITSFSSAMCRILNKYVKGGITSETCPECGEKLFRNGGCIECKNCGYSKCS